MKIGICGSRTFDDYDFFRRNIDYAIQQFNLSEEERENLEILCGPKEGADSFAVQYAKERNIPYRQFLSSTVVPSENMTQEEIEFHISDQIIEESNEMIAFNKGKEHTKGTAYIIKKAKQLDTPITVFCLFGNREEIML